MATINPQPVGAAETMPEPFGVRAGSGALLPDFDIRALKAIGVDPAPIINKAKPKDVLGAVPSVNTNRLEEAGWGVVIAPGVSDEVVKALKPLLDRRKAQARALYREFRDYQTGQSVRGWLNSKNVTLALVDPTNGVPLYLLLVGSPAQIPFEFQYMLDSYWNVGRLDFDTAAEYAAYAEAVVKYETEAVPTTRSSALWVTQNQGDRATGLLHNQIAVPLAKGVGSAPPLGTNERFARGEFLADLATRGNLEAILRGDISTGRPALLFTGSHGVAFDTGDAGQRDGQGALLSQAWVKGGAATPDQYLRGDDVPADAKVHGMIHFMFACYGGGCPANDTYDRDDNGKPLPLMKAPIVARLPQRLLAKGALAVLAHVDRAWSYSFQTPGGAPQVQEFRSVMDRLLAGDRIGQATDDFNRRWSVLGSELQMVVDEHQATDNVPAPNLANRMVARDDARNYVILGDPAVQLRVKDMP